ncbi:hypothetical protein SAMN04488128_104435 [Chitinophaga eiseniae]|uniref:Uncharacterized protein n=1 Tax=Chitinophaga eiseniae TaxID=634771 RepID=A0A1T4TDK8_9BACT|nr:hypothetical protein [Chitinophaga eiseniae]SKA38421.1 hypothetical protein SAMN04488128_104435 [Chitinophaga eiseniae]
MGNRTYLTIRTAPEQQEVLFEGNNSLAYFWLLLLKKKDVEQVRPAFLTLYAAGDTAETAEEQEDTYVDTDIRIPLAEALSNAAAHRPYIEKVYPSLLPLYDDWRTYLASVPSHDQLLYIDLEEFSGFYANVNHFLEELLDFYQHVSANKAYFKPAISDTTGWEAIGRKQFYTYSGHYRNTPEIVDYQQRSLPAKPLSTGYRILIGCWVVFSLALLAAGTYSLGYFRPVWLKALMALLIITPLLLLAVGGLVWLMNKGTKTK